MNGFELFSYWEPKWQAFFIFSCCICVAAWAAALVLAAFDSSTLKRRQVEAPAQQCMHATRCMRWRRRPVCLAPAGPQRQVRLPCSPPQMVTMCSTAGGLDKEAPLDAAFNKDSAFAAVVLPAV